MFLTKLRQKGGTNESQWLDTPSTCPTTSLQTGIDHSLGTEQERSLPRITVVGDFFRLANWIPLIVEASMAGVPS